MSEAVAQEREHLTWDAFGDASREIARAIIADGFVPGGSRRNLDWVRPHLTTGIGITEEDLVLLADAQPSGGLLVVGELPGHPVIGHTVAGTGIQVR